MKSLVVVLNYNNYNETFLYIKKIETYKNINYIVVVDNDSTGVDYAELVKLQNEKILVIKTEKNGGYSRGNNYGIKMGLRKWIDIDVVFISNPDIVVDDSAFLDIAHALSDHNNVVASGKIYNKGQSDIFAFAEPTYVRMLLNIYPWTRKLLAWWLQKQNIYIGKYLELECKKKQIVEVGTVGGCFFAVDMDFLKSIDFFDEKTFLYCEEEILSKMVHEKGFREVLVTNHVIIHEGNTSTKKAFRFFTKEFIQLKSIEYFMYEYLNCNLMLVEFYKACYMSKALLKYLKMKVLRE